MESKLLNTDTKPQKQVSVNMDEAPGVRPADASILKPL